MTVGDDGHGEPEDTHEGVSAVFSPGGDSTCGPRHALSHARGVQCLVVKEDVTIDAGAFNEGCNERIFPTQEGPERRQEDDVFLGEKLLECPSSFVILAFAKCGVGFERVVIAGNVVEVNIAEIGGLVPGIHRVNCLGQFSAAGLVYAAGVDPDPLVAFVGCQEAESVDFARSMSHGTLFRVVVLLVCGLDALEAV